MRHNRQFFQLVGHVWQERGSIAGVPLRDLLAAESYQAIRAMFERMRVSGEVLAIDEAAAVELRIRDDGVGFDCTFAAVSPSPSPVWGDATASSIPL